MYAIIETGGKQYKVQEGDTLRIEMLKEAPGETVVIDRVLTVVQDDKALIGQPVVAGAKVVLKVLEHGKGEKILIFKYKSKKKYRKTRGHRQPYTEVMVEKLEVND